MKLSELRQGLTEVFKVRQIDHDPNRKLWLNVFYQAVLDIVEGLSADYLDAKLWVANTEDYGVNSFISVCNTVDIDCEEAKNILLNKKIKMVWVVDGIEYNTLKGAAKVHGVSISAIRNWCVGQYYNEKYQYPPRKACGRRLKIYGGR